MHGRGPYYASPSQLRGGNLVIKIKRGGPAGSGSGPQGRKATKRALLARAMRERAGVDKAVRERQAARVAAKAAPIKLAGWPLG